MCLRTWMRWDVQQNVSTSTISVFLLLLFSMEQKGEISKGTADPPLTNGNTHCSGDAKKSLLAANPHTCNRLFPLPQEPAVRNPQQSCPPSNKGTPQENCKASMGMPGPFLDLICS